jgi:hypothetical protein
LSKYALFVLFLIKTEEENEKQRPLVEEKHKKRWEKVVKCVKIL